MDYDKFYGWLTSSKEMNNRSAKDVISRCKRVCSISGLSKINEQTESRLVESAEYGEFSVFVKSQLKRSVALYNEFLKG